MTSIKMSVRHEVQTVKICCNHKVFLPVMKQCTNYVKKKIIIENTEETTVHVYDQKMIFWGNWHGLSSKLIQSNPALRSPAHYGHLIITDSFLCPWGKPLHFP